MPSLSRARSRARLALAAVVTVLAVLGLAACNGTKTVTDDGPPPAPGGADVATLFDGIPQSNLMLGTVGAPLTLVEYLDMEDPASETFATEDLPGLLNDFVRPGKLRVELRLDSASGRDSVRVARSVVAAAFQNHAFEFAQLVFVNHERPHGGHELLQTFLRAITHAIPVLDGEDLGNDALSPASRRPLRQTTTEMRVFGMTKAPAFRIGKTGGVLTPISLTDLRYAIAHHALPYVG